VRGTRPYDVAGATTSDGLPVRFTRVPGRVYAVVVGRPTGSTVRIQGVELPAARGRLLADGSTPIGRVVCRLPAERVDDVPRPLVQVVVGRDQVAVSVDNHRRRGRWPRRMRSSAVRTGSSLGHGTGSPGRRGVAGRQEEGVYEDFVAPGEFIFRRDNAARLDDVVKFNWEMLRTSDGTIAAVGLEILVLNDDDRIRTDYQFIE
jgi:hypothetical protein